MVRSKLSGSIADGGDVRSFSVAPDGGAVVFSGDLRVLDQQELFVRRFADPGRVPLLQDPVTGRGVRNHAIAPDSSRVVFDGDLDGDDVDGVYSVPLTGGAVAQLNEDGSQALLAFGEEIPLSVFVADGSRVVFNQFVPAPGAVTLRSVAAEGGTPHVLDSVATADGRFFPSPLVTPDGLRVVYLLLDDEELFLQVRVVDSAHRCAGRVATIIGTDGPDPLRGTPGDDVVVGLGGRDTIATGRGQDVVCAGSGNDRVRTGPGDDIVVAGRGADVVRGGPGRDRLVGQGGPDRLLAGAGNDLLRGNRGRDVLAGQRGDDRIVGGPGRDRCTGGPGRDRILGCERG